MSSQTSAEQELETLRANQISVIMVRLPTTGHLQFKALCKDSGFSMNELCNALICAAIADAQAAKEAIDWYRKQKAVPKI